MTSRRLPGWTGAWAGLVVLSGWFLGTTARAPCLDLAAVGEGGGWSKFRMSFGRAWPEFAADPAVILLVLSVGLAVTTLVRDAFGPGRPAARWSWGPWLAWGLAAVASGWRGAALSRGQELASWVPSEGQRLWVVAVERIEWDRCPLSWSGHAFAWIDRGCWRAPPSGVPVRGVWAAPERGGMLLFASAGRARQGDAVVLRVQRAFRLTGVPGEGTRGPAARSSFLRASLCTKVVAALGLDAGALAARTLLGPVPQLPTEWERSFRETGTMHLLSISGFHLTLIGGILWLAVRIATRGAAWAHWPALIALGLYSYFVGGTAPILRACGAAYLLAVGSGWGRRYRFWNALGWTAAILPLLDPRVAGTPSFQLSFAAMAGVVWGGSLPLLSLEGTGTGARRRARRRALLGPPLQLLLASVGATLLTAPWSFHYFSLLYPLGVVANLLAIPTMAVTLAVQMVAVIAIGLGAGPRFPFVAAGRACGEGFLVGLDRLAEVCSRWSCLGSCDMGAALSWTCFLGLGLCVLSRAREARRLRSTSPWLAAAVLPVGLALLHANLREAPFARADGEVNFLDVGQGDAALLRLGGRRWLVDLGVGSQNGRRDRLVPALLAHRVRRLERIWITHGDSDHWGGVADLLVSPVRVDTLVLPRGAPFPRAFWETLRAAPQRPVVIRLGDDWSREMDAGLRVRLLHPPARFAAADAVPRHVNAWSLVLWFEWPPDTRGHSIRMLLSGDLEKEREAGMMRRWGAGPPITVAELAHHGSRSAGSEAWWGRARPLLAVLSVGAGNVYRLPHPTTLERVRQGGTCLRRTDEEGEVRCAIAPGRLWVRSQRPPCPSPGPVL